MTVPQWLAPETCAELLGGISVRRVRQMVGEGKLIARRNVRGRNGKAIEIAADSLPPEARTRLSESQLATVTKLEVVPASRTFDELPASIRDRANLRLAAITSYQIAIRTMRRGEILSIVEQRWLESFRADHPEMRVSVKSVRRWTEAYKSGGREALIDHNDGSSRRGQFNIPREALAFFHAAYLDTKRNLTIRGAIRETRLMAQREGWKLPRRDDSFYRYAKSISPLVKALRRSAVDEPHTVLDSVLRGMEKPYRTLQSDHHICDVFVSCEGTVCGPDGCKAGHRPWWTVMTDVGSRKIVSYRIALEVPNSTRILEAFRLAVEREGLPQQFYVDNGKDYKKATGKNLSAEEQEFLSNRFRSLGVNVIWAKPYNAQAKAVERMFGTWVSQVWRSFESYVGRTGKRSEHAHHLYQHPELLPTFTDFAAQLEAQVDLFNHQPHRGVGMNRRSPAEVFAAERIARRNPDPAAFALVFWRCETRVLSRHGVSVDNTLYRLEDPTGEIQLRYQGERVKILIDQADISRAIVCSIDERFLAHAVVRELASHDASDPVTQAEIERVAKHNKAISRRAKEGDRTAQQQVAWLRQPHNRLQMLRKLAAQRTEQVREMVAQTGTDAATVVLPRFSSIAREMASAKASSGPRLSDADRELAASVPEISDEQLDRLIAEERGYEERPRLRVVEDDDTDVAAELARLARMRKAKEGLCLVEGCEEPRTHVIDEADECARHWAELHLAEIDNDAVREAVRQQLEEEVH